MTGDHYYKMFCVRAKAVLVLQDCGRCEHICPAGAVDIALLPREFD